jgi:protein-S-isoprenylcysteine O-methyltransferase Ste14
VTAHDTDNAGVIARPPLIYLGFLALGLVLDLVWPASIFDGGARYSAGFVLVAAGAGIVALGFREFRKAGTNVEPDKPTTAIVVTGPFAYSRNPLYVSLSLIYVGIAIAADSAWTLLLLAPMLAVMRYGVIAREERYLERKFGEEYLRYKARVRRWV